MRARDNPFSTDRVLKVRYRPRGWTWDELLDRLAALQYSAAIVGPEGRGKTTLMEDLEPHLRARGFDVKHLRLTRERRKFDPGWLRDFFATVTSKDILLFDGAEQLTRLAWWRFRRRALSLAAGLVITSHRPGLLPTLVECDTDADLLRGIVNDLLPDPAAPETDAADLLTRHDGNVREALRELYDRHAGW